MSKKLGYVGEAGRISLKEVLHSFKDTVLALLMPVIILGGIYGGIFTPTESAVVGVVYALFIGTFVYHEINGRTLFEALRDTVLINGATSFVLGLSTSFAGYLAMAQVPATIADFFMSISDNKIVILLLMNLFLLLIGCFIDNISATIILTPILLPVVLALGMGPVHFGIMLTINLAIGFVTPPYGVNLFFASAVANVSVERISKYIIPFIAALLVVLMLVTFVEPVSMLVPSLLK